jgi:PPM family protein phosphatase
MVIDYFGLSDIGPIREDNQDTIHLPDTSMESQNGYLFGVADGMGGFSHGGVASSLALEALSTVYNQNGKPQRIPQTLRKGIDAANLAVVNEANRLSVNQMGTTLTALAFEPIELNRTQNRLHVGHIGDSRAYLIRERKVECLTNDHTVVGDLLRMRVLTQNQVRTHARRSVLTRAIGLGLFIQPEFTVLNLQEDDRIILCTDGLWAAIQDEEFGHISNGVDDMEKVCKDAIDLALDHGTDDNLSVVAIHVKSLQGGENGKVHKSWIQRIFATQNGRQ